MSKDTKILEFSVPKDAKEKFEDFAKKFPFDPYTQPEAVMKVMGGKLEELFPTDLLGTLKKMGEVGDPGIILIRNFPIDTIVPEAKTVVERSQLKGRSSEKAIIGTVGLMGYKLHSNPKEQSGRIIHNVAPVAGFESTTSSKGRDPFYLHTENPFDKNPPDFLILVALEGDTQAKTTYFYVDGFIHQFPQWVVEGMKKPEFEIRSGAGFDDVEKGTFSLITKEKDTGRLRLRLYQSRERIKPLTPEAEKVVAYITEAFKEMEKTKGIDGVGLEPGEAVIINNGWGMDKLTGVMHGRGGMIQNQNRWLQRGFLYKQTESDTSKIADGYYKAVRHAMRNRRFTTREAAGVLRKAMLESNDCRKYKETHPTATDAQIMLYGTNPNPKGKGNWVRQITAEAVMKTESMAKL